MKPVYLGLVLAAAAVAQDPFSGTFEGPQIVLDLKGGRGAYSGTLTVQGQGIPTSVTVNGTTGAGTFAMGVMQVQYTLTPAEDGLEMSVAGSTQRLVRRAAVPAGQTAGAGNGAAGIVGSWRNAQGYARFNADGTGVVDGTPGRYQIGGNQVTLIGPEGQLTLGFRLERDTLTLLAGANAIVLQRERERAPGVAGIRQELVGKWCWISVTTANQGARQSNRCVTLDAGGTYVYEGMTDSYNPYGGATSESRDVGTWDATDTTLTGRSRTGKVTTYRLEKRNHPKNNDPMIVLDGEPFVTFYRKAPW